MKRESLKIKKLKNIKLFLCIIHIDAELVYRKISEPCVKYPINRDSMEKRLKTDLEIRKLGKDCVCLCVMVVVQMDISLFLYFTL